MRLFEYIWVYLSRETLPLTCGFFYHRLWVRNVWRCQCGNQTPHNGDSYRFYIVLYSKNKIPNIGVINIRKSRTNMQDNYQRKTNLQQSTQHYTENFKLSNKEPPKLSIVNSDACCSTVLLLLLHTHLKPNQEKKM
jgi:dTDP-4-amino-4,6-dideoxygalactose transaminase